MKYQIKVSASITTRNTSFDVYCNSLPKRKILTVDQEHKLFLIYRINPGSKESKAAKKELIESNLLFVISIAKKYDGLLPLMDLIQAGNLGLLIAVERFDPTRGFKLISFAVNWIRCYIMEAIRKDSKIIVTPSHIKYDERAVVFSLNQLNHKDDDHPYEKQDLLLSDINTDEEFFHKDLGLVLRKAIEKLHEPDRAYIKEAYGIDCEQLSIEEIGKKHFRTRESVGAHVKSAKKKLYRIAGKELLAFM